MNLTDITTTHNGEQVVDGIGFCKAVAKSASIDPFRAFLLVGKAAQEMGAEVLCVGPKGDQSAYRLTAAEQIANSVMAVA